MMNVENIRNYPVKKSNDVIQKTMCMLTAQEFDLLQYLIMQIRDEDTEIKEQIIDIKEFCRITGIKEAGDNYKNIKKSLQSLANKSVWTELPLNKGREQLCRWIDDPWIDKGNGKVCVKLKKYWEPYLLELKKRYTVTTLKETLPMKSVYGKRLYELLNSYLMGQGNSAHIEFSIDELKIKLLGEQWDKKYKEFKNFKLKVLRPALKDLDNYGHLQVSMTLKRVGRSYAYAYFDVEEKAFEKKLAAAKKEQEFFE